MRRPAASGLVRLMRRGYQSPRLTNALLVAVSDVDQEVARNAFVALTYLDPEDILDDLMLVLENFTSSQIQHVCHSLGHLPSRSGVRLINWILDVSTDQDVVSTALASENNLLGRARRSMQLAFAKELLSVESVDRAAVRALRLLGSPAAHVRASSLVVISQLARYRC